MYLPELQKGSAVLLKGLHFRPLDNVSDVPYLFMHASLQQTVSAAGSGSSWDKAGELNPGPIPPSNSLHQTDGCHPMGLWIICLAKMGIAVTVYAACVQPSAAHEAFGWHPWL